MKKLLLALLVAATLVGCSKYDFESQRRFEASIEDQADKEDIDRKEALRIVDWYVGEIKKDKSDIKKKFSDLEKAEEEEIEKATKGKDYKERKMIRKGIEKKYKKEELKIYKEIMGYKTLEEMKTFLKGKIKDFDRFF